MYNGREVHSTLSPVIAMKKNSIVGSAYVAGGTLRVSANESDLDQGMPIC